MVACIKLSMGHQFRVQEQGIDVNKHTLRFIRNLLDKQPVCLLCHINVTIFFSVIKIRRSLKANVSKHLDHKILIE